MSFEIKGKKREKSINKGFPRKFPHQLMPLDHIILNCWRIQGKQFPRERFPGKQDSRGHSARSEFLRIKVRSSPGERVFCPATRRPCTPGQDAKRRATARGQKREWFKRGSSAPRRIDHHHHARIMPVPSCGGNRAIPICRRVNLGGTVFFEWVDRGFFFLLLVLERRISKLPREGDK